MRSETNSDLKFILILSAIVMLIISLPYLYLYFQTPTGAVYFWTSMLNPADMPVYFSYIEQTKQGHLLFSDLYTSEPHQPFLNIFLLAVGLTAKFFNLSAPIIFHLTRLTLIPFFIWTLKKIIDFFEPHWHPRLLLVLITFTTGFGLLLAPLMSRENIFQVGAGLDLLAAEATPFMSMFYSGHFILSWLALLWSIIFTIKSYQKQSCLYAVAAGIINLFFFQFHPYYAPLIFIFSLTILLYALFKKKLKNIWFFLLQMTIPLPSIIYYFYLFFTDERASIFLSQNYLPSPAWWVTLFSFGFLGPLAIGGLAILTIKKQWSEKYLFLFFWLTATALLLYSPLRSQRRFIEGMFIPIFFFALVPFKTAFVQRYLNARHTACLIVVIILFLFSSQTTFTILYLHYLSPKQWPQAIYFDKSIIQAAQWLKNETTARDIIMAATDNGNIIPSISGRRVFAGHLGETLFFDLKKTVISDFFRNQKDNKRIDFLANHKISLIFWSKEEKALGNFQPEIKKYLQKIYDKDWVQIYRVL
ncbi:MAG: hypothetical protein HZC05_00930 [Candidatus Magasanikbacteria bacterium]|nr:hypothetical protein [Candidatus Magasanikbacteria bacterium]